MNKLIIDGIDYTENKRSIYRLNKQNIIDDYIKLIVKNGKTEQENQQLKEELNTCMIERNKLVDVIEEAIYYISNHSGLSEINISGLPKCNIFKGSIDELTNILQKYKGDNNE